MNQPDWALVDTILLIIIVDFDALYILFL